MTSTSAAIALVGRAYQNFIKSVSYQIGSERMTDIKCSIFESVYNMPELKSCPIETTFKIIGKRWTVLIIKEILRGNTQFNRFMENITGISPKVLTERLRELEQLGIIKRRIDRNTQLG
jgi:DNA-binding HxlR family transcriptional regulator